MDRDEPDVASGDPVMRKLLEVLKKDQEAQEIPGGIPEDERPGTVALSVVLTTCEGGEILPERTCYARGFVNLRVNREHGIPSGASVNFNGFSQILPAIERALGLAGIAVKQIPGKPGIWVMNRPKKGGE